MDTRRAADSDPTAALLVACLCARWCRTCETYGTSFRAVRDGFLARPQAPALRFVWIDIEDEADLIGDLDIEDFPTVLLARQDRVCFFGPLLPHAATLDRLVQGALDGALPPPPADLPPDVLALPARLGAHPAI